MGGRPKLSFAVLKLFFDCDTDKFRAQLAPIEDLVHALAGTFRQARVDHFRFLRGGHRYEVRSHGSYLLAPLANVNRVGYV